MQTITNIVPTFKMALILTVLMAKEGVWYSLVPHEEKDQNYEGEPRFEISNKVENQLYVKHLFETKNVELEHEAQKVLSIIE